MKSSTGRRSFLATCALAGAAATRPLAAFGQAVEKAPQASSPSALRITDVKCGYVRGSLFVKIHTNQGIWGCGEAVDAIQGTYHMVQSFGQRLRNQSPLNVHRLFEQLRKGSVFGGAQSGIFVAVLSAVETALWDLAGKALNVPVYQLLGGKFRDRIRVYLDTALYQTKLPTPEQFAQAASKAAKDGDVHAGLRSREHALLADLFEQPVNVQRALVTEPLAEGLDEVIGPLDRVDPFAASPYALIRVDLHEEASTHVAALQIGDAQSGRRRRLPCVVHGLSIRGKRARGGRACQRAGRLEGAPAGGRLVHDGSYLISNTYARAPGSGAGPVCRVPAGTNVARGEEPSKISSTASPT